MLTRRKAATLLVLGAGASPAAAAAPPASNYTIGITSNTIGGWEQDVFLSFREARAVGYRYVESFIHYFIDYWEKPGELQKRLDEIGVRFVTISNGGPLEMHFEDPARHGKLIEDHLRLGRFIKHFGCRHLKINLGPRRAEGTTGEDLRQIADVLGKLGARLRSESGIQLAVHAHMWAQFENQREVDYVMGNTDARDVAFVLDTGHITMAGMDPVALTKRLGHRIVEFHMKDCKPEWKGGARKRYDRPDMMKNPPFFPLGHGGVDFAAIKAHLDSIGWKGFFTVELDSSPFRPPRESAAMSLRFLRETLKLGKSSAI